MGHPTERVLSHVVTAGTAHTNSTTEAVVASATIQANTLMAGKILRFRATILCTATDSTDTLLQTLRVHTSNVIGGTTVGVGGSAVDVADNDIGTCDIEFIPTSAAGSTAGGAVVRGWITNVDAPGVAVPFMVGKVLASLDYTAALYITLGADWSVAAAANSVESRVVTLSEIV